jgi:hypothetical protein
MAYAAEVSPLAVVDINLKVIATSVLIRLIPASKTNIQTQLCIYDTLPELINIQPALW